MKKLLSLFLFGVSSFFASAQQKILCTVYNGVTKATVPFATVKLGASGRGTIANLDGVFELTPGDTVGIGSLEISCLGYAPGVVTLPLHDRRVYLQPANNALKEVVIRPDRDKIRWILNNAIENKSKNNPDKYDWYRCKVYYKMLVDVNPPDSSMKDTSKVSREIREFLKNQHLLMSETYSTRTWKKPQQLQEVVTGSRFSGLQKSLFTGLVTDILPFHAYNNYITLNAKDYHNPLSSGYGQYYKFRLVNEIQQGADTIWELQFNPRGVNANDLNGTLFIHSNGYAISKLIASSSDTMLKRDVRLEQEYQLVTADGESHWFPAHLNYIIDWDQKTTDGTIKYYLKGNSSIDSVSFKDNSHFHFDKLHSVKLAEGSDQLPDSLWVHQRPVALDEKEARTYKVLDSLGILYHFDRYAAYMKRLPEGKVPIGIVDFDIKKLFSSNYYENVRLGIGLQTNEHLVKWFSIGGWAGYGFSDKKWKYGYFGELYLNRTHEFVVKAGYSDDINDPGRVKVNDEIDKNYLNIYLLSRVDHVTTTFCSVKKKFGYWSFELAGRQQHITPLYPYALSEDGNLYTSFNATEASLSFRYAFASRTAPYYDRYYSSGTKYPIWYGKITSGTLTTVALTVPYTQAVTAISWQKHLNRWGNDHYLLKAGKSLSNGALPLGKLFAGNGFSFDADKGINLSYYSFGGLETMLPYGYYSDQFVNFIYRHDFDWKLCKIKFPGNYFSTAPFFGLQYGILYGTLQHKEAQQLAAFSVPDNAYNEAGILLNNLLRVNYYNFMYITLSTGYFYHITAAANNNNPGKFVIGIGAEF